MPDHPQSERRKAKRLGAGAQIEPSRKVYYDEFLDTCHHIARCCGAQTAPQQNAATFLPRDHWTPDDITES
jgi:hypothetical protein